MRRAALTLVGLVSSSPAHGQGDLPDGWTVTLDAPADTSAWSFDRMPPGWHVTMGPGGLVFDSLNQAAGRFSLEAEIFLFPSSSAGEYGIFLGRSGSGWTAFVVRRDGSAAIARHDGDGAVMLAPWAERDSVPKLDPNGPVKVVLRVDAEPDSVRFHVNGGRVAAVGRAAAMVEGGFGLRAGPGVNLHVSRLDHTRRLAPPRGG